jgi:exonuclease III
MDCETILNLNAQGLNSRARRDVVAGLVTHERASMVCLQETKFNVIDDRMTANMIGLTFDYVFVPALDTCGGILVA